MENILNYLKEFRGGKLLAIFPHPDDESYVSGGLFQYLDKFDIDTRLLCLTQGENHKNSGYERDFAEKRKNELTKAASVLGIDNFEVLDFNDGELIGSEKKWLDEVEKNIKEYKPDLVLTYDPSGVTGHPDHVVSAVKIYDLLRKIGNIKLIWRVSDVQEREHFGKSYQMAMPGKPTHYLDLKLSVSIKKLKAILSHKSQFKNILFRLRVVEWYLFDHKELYQIVDLSKKVNYHLNIK